MYAGQCGSLVARTASRRGSCGPRRRTIPDRFVDLHTHILPSIDDGTRSLAEARSLAAAAFDEGTVAIAATPHVRDDYPTTATQMEAGVAELRAHLADARLPIDVLHGGEVALERAVSMDEEELIRFTLAQTGRYLLVEFPYYAWPLAVDAVIRKLAALRITPLIAHPERNAQIQERPERLRDLVSDGALVQVTAASVDGRLGRRAYWAARQLLELRLVHVLASDAHAPAVREVGLERATAAIGDPGLASYLAADAPAAIVAGEPVSVPPPLRRRRRLLRRRRARRGPE